MQLGSQNAPLRLLRIIVLLATLVSAGALLMPHARAAEGPFTVFVPLAIRSGTQPPSPTPTPQPLPPQGASGALLFGDRSYRSSSIALDAQGGMHVAFAKTAPLLDGEQNAVYYGYCSGANPAACAKLDSWQITVIDATPGGWPWVQLKLTPEGQPRVLLLGISGWDGGGLATGMVHRYTECGGNCADSASWRSSELFRARSYGGLSDTDYSYHTFALDNQGRPRFLYEALDPNNGAHRGAFYVYCNAENCADPSGWYETQIDAHQGETLYINERTLLAFTQDGRPRIFSDDGRSPEQLVYVECDANCEQSESWSQQAHLYETGSGSSPYGWSAAFTASGQPRVAFYPRGGDLHYLWCNQSCTDPSQWDGTRFVLEGHSGNYPALALDAQDRPRIAYQDTNEYGLGYAFCNANCEAANSSWTFLLAEHDPAIAAALPAVKPEPHCIRGSWYGGIRPSLALDAQGNPRIFSDAYFMEECRRNPTDQTTYFEKIWFTSRLVFFPQPQ